MNNHDENAPASPPNWPIELIEEIADRLARNHPPEDELEWFNPEYWKGQADSAIHYLNARRKGCEQAAERAKGIFWQLEGDPLWQHKMAKAWAADQKLAAEEAWIKALPLVELVSLLTGKPGTSRKTKTFIQYLASEVEADTSLWREYRADLLTSASDVTTHPSISTEGMRADVGEKVSRWVNLLVSRPNRLSKLVAIKGRFEEKRKEEISALRAAAARQRHALKNPKKVQPSSSGVAS